VVYHHLSVALALVLELELELELELNQNYRLMDSFLVQMGQFEVYFLEASVQPLVQY